MKQYKSISSLAFRVMNACCGSLLFGMFMSGYNPVQLTFHKMYQWSDEQKQLYDGLITSSFPIGGFFGCLLAGWISKFGRRQAMIVSDLISTVGIAFTIVGPNSFPVPTICIGRFIVGLMIGINCSTVNLYINEIIPSELTSSMGAYFQLFLNIGITTGLVIALARPNIEGLKGDEDNQFWRIIFAASFFPILIRLIGQIFIYKTETPLYYYQRANTTQAKIELQRIYTTSEVVENQLNQLQIKTEELNEDITYTDLFKNKYLRRTLIGILLASAQQLSGINSVVFFSTDIFAPDGDDSSQSELNVATYFSILVAFFLTIPQLLAGSIIGRFGRKKILIAGQIAVIIMLIVLAIFDHFRANKYIILVAILLYCFCFGISGGPIVWFYVPEFCPPKGVAVSTLINWFWVTVIGFGFQYLKETLSLGGAFIIFALISSILGILMLKFCIETKDKTTEEILQAFEARTIKKMQQQI